MFTGGVPPPLQLDLVDAAQSSGSATLNAQLEKCRQARSADTTAAAFRDALLAGGNASRGRDTFAGNPAAGCPRCHIARRT
jgi:hypothetical protein